jgi:hypothetical protein
MINKTRFYIKFYFLFSLIRQVTKRFLNNKYFNSNKNKLHKYKLQLQHK